MRAVVVAGGDPDPADAGWLDDADLVIAADAGAAWLVTVGRPPDVLVGDLDSVDPLLVERLAADGTVVERHPAEKDASDAELAVLRAVTAGADEIVLVGGLSGERLDHELANLLLLADPELHGQAPDLRLVRGGTTARAVRGGETMALQGGIGAWVTLLPMGGDAMGVTTVGLRFPLRGEALHMGRSRGLSNVVDEEPASVSLEGGVLLVVETRNGGSA